MMAAGFQKSLKSVFHFSRTRKSLKIEYYLEGFYFDGIWS